MKARPINKEGVIAKEEGATIKAEMTILGEKVATHDSGPRKAHFVRQLEGRYGQMVRKVQL